MHSDWIWNQRFWLSYNNCQQKTQRCYAGSFYSKDLEGSLVNIRKQLGNNSWSTRDSSPGWIFWLSGKSVTPPKSSPSTKDQGIFSFHSISHMFRMIHVFANALPGENFVPSQTVSSANSARLRCWNCRCHRNDRHWSVGLDKAWSLNKVAIKGKNLWSLRGQFFENFFPCILWNYGDLNIVFIPQDQGKNSIFAESLYAIKWVNQDHIIEYLHENLPIRTKKIGCSWPALKSYLHTLRKSIGR